MSRRIEPIEPTIGTHGITNANPEPIDIMPDRPGVIQPEPLDVPSPRSVAAVEPMQIDAPQPVQNPSTLLEYSAGPRESVSHNIEPIDIRPPMETIQPAPLQIGEPTLNSSAPPRLDQVTVRRETPPFYGPERSVWYDAPERVIIHWFS